MDSISPQGFNVLVRKTSGLLEDLRYDVKASNLGGERWYLMVVIALSGRPTALSPAAIIDTRSPLSFSRTPTRSCCQMCGFLWSLHFRSIHAIDRIGKDRDKDFTATGDRWLCDGANLERDMDWMRKVYKQNIEGVVDLNEYHVLKIPEGSRLKGGRYEDLEWCTDDHKAVRFEAWSSHHCWLCEGYVAFVGKSCSRLARSDWKLSLKCLV